MCVRYLKISDSTSARRPRALSAPRGGLRGTRADAVVRCQCAPGYYRLDGGTGFWHEAQGCQDRTVGPPCALQVPWAAAGGRVQRYALARASLFVAGEKWESRARMREATSGTMTGR